MLSHIPAPQPLGPNTPLLEDDDSTGSNLIMDTPPEHIRRQMLEERKRKERERKNQMAALLSVTQPTVSNFSPISYYQQPTVSNVSRINNYQPLRHIPAPQPLGPNTPLLEDDDSTSSNLVMDAPPEHIRAFLQPGAGSDLVFVARGGRPWMRF